MAPTTRSSTSEDMKKQAHDRGIRKRPPKGSNNAYLHHGQRSSLRRALRESLIDTSAFTSSAATNAAAGTNISNPSAVASTTTPDNASSTPASQNRAPSTPSSPDLSPSQLQPHTPRSSSASPESNAEQQKPSLPVLAPSPEAAFLLTPQSSSSSVPASTPSAPSLTPSSSLSPSSIASPAHSFFRSPPVLPVAAAVHRSGLSIPRGGGAKRKTRSNAAATGKAEAIPPASTPSTPSRSRFRGGWHSIKEIVGEGRDQGALVYLVEWEGNDPSTGVMWPSSWVDAKNVNDTAIQDWKARNQKTTSN